MWKLADLAATWWRKKMRSKHKAQVIQANPAPTESTQIDRLMDIFLSAARYLMELGRPGRVGWLDGGEKTASRAERAASWRNDPRIQLFFFLLSPRCLEKHKDFDIWAEQRSGNTTMAHADSFICVFFPSPRRRNYTTTTLEQVATFYCLATIS